MSSRATATDRGTRRQLRAGRLDATLDGTALRWIRCDGLEVLRGIDLTIREPEWGTVLPRIRSVDETTRGSNVTISIEASYRGSGRELEAVIRIELDASEATYSVEYETLSETRLNRIGVIVLHPMSVAGRRLVVGHLEGGESIRFPKAIDPNVVATDIVGLAWRPVAGLSGRLDFDGDQWEMEDQRNWTDASFKTYPRPLRLPYPFTLAAGTHGSSSVRVTFSGTPRPSSRPASEALEVRDRAAGRLPALGTEARSIPLTSEQVAAAHSLGLGYLRVGVAVRGDDAREALERLTQVRMAGLPVEVDVVADPGSKSLAGVADELSDSTCVGVNVFSARTPDALDSDPEVVSYWAGLATAAGLRAPIGAGTRANFTELNRTHPPAQAGTVTFGLNPQVHAFDGEAILETAGTIAAITQQASRIAGRRPLSVVVSSRMRPADILAPCAADPRFLQPLGAAWLTGLLASMPAPRVARVTLLTLEELASAWAADEPTARVVGALTELEDPRLLVAPAVSDVAILAIRHREGYRVLVANLRFDTTEASLRLPCSGAWSVTSLTTASKASAMEAPVSREVTAQLVGVEVKRLDHQRLATK
jgi:hypothetical protein